MDNEHRDPVTVRTKTADVLTGMKHAIGACQREHMQAGDDEVTELLGWLYGLTRSVEEAIGYSDDDQIARLAALLKALDVATGGYDFKDAITAIIEFAEHGEA